MVKVQTIVTPAKAEVHNHLNILDSCFCRNDGKRRLLTFYETVNCDGRKETISDRLRGLNIFHNHQSTDDKSMTLKPHLCREFYAMILSKSVFLIFGKGMLYGKKKLTQKSCLCMKEKAEGHDALDPKYIIDPAYLKSG